MNKKLKAMWDKFGVLALVGASGLIPSEYLFNPDLAIALKVSGMISLFLAITAIALDDRQGKGLFPSYDEDALIANAATSPIASALVILSKTILLAVILVLAVMFVRP